MNQQYLNYNYCEVVINGYTITNVLTEGMPSKKCGAHLESLTIESPPIQGGNNPSDIAISGTVNVIDYRDAVFNVLRGKLSDYINHKNNESERNTYLSEIKITIKCFTGEKTWYGKILNWEFNFVGTTPTLSIKWQSFPPTDGDTKPLQKGEYNSPKDLIKALRENYKPDIPIVYVGDGLSSRNINDDLKFIGGKLMFDTTGIKTCGNRLVDAYNFMISNSTTSDGESLVGQYDAESNQFIVAYKNIEKNSKSDENTATTGQLVFVQNGSYKYYEPRKSDGKYVIPMTSFNYGVTQENLTLQARILNNPNGTTVSGGSGKQDDVTVKPDEDPAKRTEGMTGSNDSSTVKVTFECYNVLSFAVNCLKQQIPYEIYNELGDYSVISGIGTVESCSYSLSGGVVKANVTCNEYYGSADVSEKGDANAGTGKEGDGSGNTDGELTSDSPAEKFDGSTYESYLRMEDDIPIPLSKDMTAACISNGKFGKHVDEFLDRYGDLESTARRLDWSFVKKVLTDGDIGLLSLLYGPAHYGIKDPPSNWPKNDQVKYPPRDPVLHDPGHTKSKEFCAGNIGKLPYHYKIGGLGIAHWDAENLDDIYLTCGFDPHMSQADRDHFAKLIISEPVKQSDKAKFTGKVVGWKSGQYKGIDRLFPIFQGKCYMTRFDKGLKQDAKWLEWAKNIVYYKHPTKGRVYQHFLFEMWIRKMWLPTINKLKSSTPVKGHTICLQDAVRISRAANSRTGWISPMCGKNVSQQYDIYKSNGTQKHAMKQKAYCKRLCKILEWELK